MPKLYIIQAETAPGQYNAGRPFEKLTEAVRHINNHIKFRIDYTAVHYYIQRGNFYFYDPTTRKEYRLTVKK